MGSSRIDTFVKAWEGYRATPYKDLAGHWTGGWGHKLGPLEPKWEQDRVYWQARFSEDMWTAREAVKSLLEVKPLKQQLDAFTSFVFNLGGKRFEESTMLRLFNAGEVVLAGKQFERWNKATVNGKLIVVKGLTKRRAAEYNIYVNKDYSGRP